MTKAQTRLPSCSDWTGRKLSIFRCFDRFRDVTQTISTDTYIIPAPVTHSGAYEDMFAGGKLKIFRSVFDTIFRWCSLRYNTLIIKSNTFLH